MSAVVSHSCCSCYCVAGARDGTTATLTARTAAGALLGHVTMTYEADVTGDVIELYGRQLDAVCATMLNQHLITPPLLDNLLTEAIFDESGSSAHHVPLRAFELLFESTKYAASGTFVEYLFIYLFIKQRLTRRVSVEKTNRRRGLVT